MKSGKLKKKSLLLKVSWEQLIHKHCQRVQYLNALITFGELDMLRCRISWNPQHCKACLITRQDHVLRFLFLTQVNARLLIWTNKCPAFDERPAISKGHSRSREKRCQRKGTQHLQKTITFRGTHSVFPFFYWSSFAFGKAKIKIRHNHLLLPDVTLGRKSKRYVTVTPIYENCKNVRKMYLFQ